MPGAFSPVQRRRPTRTYACSYRRQPLIGDEAWAVIAPLFPPAGSTGRPQKWALRLLMEATVYLLRTGCQWRALPDAFPPYSTVQRHLYAWRDAGLFERINHLLVMLDREREGREPRLWPPSSTASRSRPAKRAGQKDMMGARNSRE